MRSLCLLALPLLVACAPASVAEAEARHDVAWLEQHETRAGIEALGRLADHDSTVAEHLAKRSGSADTYHAAWQAHTRGARWGVDLLQAALASPPELAVAVAELPAKDPRLEVFVPALERGIAGARPDVASAAVALVASVGPSVQPTLIRMADAPLTRTATCTGLAASTTADESHFVLTKAKEETRLDPACRKTLLQHVLTDMVLLDWLGDHGEPPLVAEAATTLDCAKLAELWEHVFSSGRATLVPTEAALSVSIQRCPAELDPVLSRTLSSNPPVRGSVLRALDADALRAKELSATCRELPRLAHGRALPDEVRARASELYAHRCKPPT